MRCWFSLLLVFLASPAEPAQPYGIKLDPGGLSLIYPVVGSGGWLLTQPAASRLYSYPDPARVTHWGDEYFAQDWSRSCGETHGQRLYAGISGEVVFAGWRGPYGNTVVIYDHQSRFALKYSHLSEVLVSAGEPVLAGQSLVGRVGNSGNVQGSCAAHPRAHLHLALFKNVSNPRSRPVTSTSAAAGAGPTGYAAPFGFAASAPLVKSNSDPTVYVLSGRLLKPVSAASFESHGWNFDRRRSVFDPLGAGSHSPSQISRYTKTAEFWPLRENSLIKTPSSQTVYQFEEGRKLALTSQVFSCRSLRFPEVVALPDGELPRYQPSRTELAAGCLPRARQAMRDFARFAAKRSWNRPDPGRYWLDLGWDAAWELRYLPYRDSAGRGVELFQCSQRSNPLVRYLGYYDPASGQWSGWQRAE